jgi:photosystem II stability/assembly factor-like uncharacterized protein
MKRVRTGTAFNGSLRALAVVACLLVAACGRTEGAPGEASEDGAQAPSISISPQSSGTAALLQAVSPVSGAVVWVSGHEATYARTLDGGATWTAAVMVGEEELQFRDVEAFDANTAYLMSAGTGEMSRIYRTDDGGESWQHQYTADHPEAFLDCMAFWDRDRGLVYGDEVDGVPFILSTTDGGEHWSRVPSESLPAALDGEGGFAASGTCLMTQEGGRAWVGTGAGSHPRVLMTEDWGESWTVMDVPVEGGSSAGLFTLGMTPEGEGIAFGGAVGGDTLRTDNIILTGDYGASWTTGGHPVMLGPVYGSGLVMLDGGWGVAAVGPGGLDWSGDEGRSWVAADTLTYWAVAFASPNAGWAVGPGGRITKLAVR